MKCALAAALFVAVSVGVSAQPQGALVARDDMNAAAAKGDKAAYAKFLSDDLTWVDRQGRVSNKAALVEGLVPQTGRSTTDEPPSARAYENVVVFAGTRSTTDGTVTHFLQAWVKNGNQWQLVAHQGVAPVDKPAGPATKPSSALPANVGAAAEREAVQKNIDVVDEANRKGDGKMFASAVTDQFVNVTSAGVRTKQDRIAAIAAAGAQASSSPVPARESATRVRGNLAVTTRRVAARPQLGATQQPDSWQTIVSIKEGGQWRRAGIAITAVTGAARPATQ
jgi:hypothetical protein